MQRMFDAFTMSFVLFVVAGILLLASLPTLATGNFMLWVLAKIFYVIGVIFFLFNH